MGAEDILTNLTALVDQTGDGFPNSTGVIPGGPGTPPSELPPASPTALVLLSILFCIVGFVGLTGNFLVIWVVLTDKKMRNSVTNLFIVNLAIADFLIMLFGIPEIIQVSHITLHSVTPPGGVLP